MEEAAWICVAEYCPPYWHWHSVEMTELWIIVCVSRVWTVWYSCINTESALRCAADVKVLLTSSIFLPVPSRPPCRNAPHCIQLWRVKGAETWAPPGHQPLDTCVYESQLQCQHHDRNMHHTAASHTYLQNNVICLHTGSTGQRIY